VRRVFVQFSFDLGLASGVSDWGCSTAISIAIREERVAINADNCKMKLCREYVDVDVDVNVDAGAGYAGNEVLLPPRDKSNKF
jgi:pyrrolidone-carboxylate peptidase